MVRTVEDLPRQLLSNSQTIISKSTPNIAMDAFEVQPSRFLGVTCTAYGPSEDFRIKRASLNTQKDSKETIDPTVVAFFCGNQVNATSVQHHVKNKVSYFRREV